MTERDTKEVRLYPCADCGLANPVRIEGGRCPHCQKWYLHDVAEGARR